MLSHLVSNSINMELIPRIGLKRHEHPSLFVVDARKPEVMLTPGFQVDKAIIKYNESIS
ncbi:hypothetical protein J45TS6_23230 [Paenibacillus sp. J45TS6]|nr:hypothetical protein J45TS6_23230 [Paenibacillus sp. J45TS6]